MGVRVGLAAAGVAVGAFGALKLLALGWSNLFATIPWLLGGVLLHDAVIAPLVIGLCGAGLVVVPRWARGPAVAVVVVLGSATLLAVPVLGRFGAKADNTTLLDRPYGTGWLVLAGLVFAGAALAAVVRRAKGGTQDG